MRQRAPIPRFKRPAEDLRGWRRAQALNAVRSGPHLAQWRAQTDKSRASGYFDREVDWIGMCREKPNLKVTPPPQEDEFAFSMPDPNAEPGP